MRTTLYLAVRTVDTTEWACVLCPRHIQDDWVEQQTCIKFCVKFKHSSAETIQMIQKAAAMGNWWLAASSQQHAHSYITSHAEFFDDTSNHPGDSTTLQPRFGALWLLAFPKTKITFEREVSQTISEIQENMTGQLLTIGRICEVPGTYFKGDWVFIVLCTMFLVSSSINVSIFHITFLDTFWTDLIHVNTHTTPNRKTFALNLLFLRLNFYNFLFDLFFPCPWKHNKWFRAMEMRDFSPIDFT